MADLGLGGATLVTGFGYVLLAPWRGDRSTEGWSSAGAAACSWPETLRKKHGIHASGTGHVDVEESPVLDYTRTVGYDNI